MPFSVWLGVLLAVNCHSYLDGPRRGKAAVRLRQRQPGATLSRLLGLRQQLWHLADVHCKALAKTYRDLTVNGEK